MYDYNTISSTVPAYDGRFDDGSPDVPRDDETTATVSTTTDSPGHQAQAAPPSDAKQTARVNHTNHKGGPPTNHTNANSDIRSQENDAQISSR